MACRLQRPDATLLLATINLIQEQAISRQQIRLILFIA